MKQQLDYVDRKILGILQKNARTSLKDIAAHVFLSSPAASARIEKLEKEGYIDGYHASVNKEKMGYGIKAFINIIVDAAHKETFLDRVMACPNVVECNCITGDYAMLLEVAYPNTEELEAFVAGLQSYGKTQTQIVFSTAIEHREIAACANLEETA